MGGEIDIFSIDKIFNYPLAKFLAPYLYCLKIIPNYITISNIFLRIYIFYKMYYGCNSECLKLMLLSHFLDCLDGTLARSYNLTSELGATIDHISDKIFWSSMFLISIYKCRSVLKNRNAIIVIGIIILISVLNCNITKKCDNENFIDMNAMAIITIVFFYYNTCIN